MTRASYAMFDARLRRLEDMLAGSLPPETPKLSLAGLIDDAGRQFGVSIPELKGDGRRVAATRARFAIAWVAKQATGHSAAAIGRALGDRDHSTIIHALGRADELRATEVSFRRASDQLLDQFQRDRSSNG